MVTPPLPLTTPSARWLWPAIVLAALCALGSAGYIVDELTDGDTFRIDSTILLAVRTPGDLGKPLAPAWLEQSAIDISVLSGFTLLWLLGGSAPGLIVHSRRRAEAAWLGASLVGASP